MSAPEKQNLSSSAKSWRSLQWASHVMLQRPFGLFSVMLMFLLAAFCDILTPWLIKNFLTTFETGGDPHDSYVAGAKMVGIGWIGFYIFQYLGYTLNNYFQTYGMGEIYKRLYDRVQYASQSWHGDTLMGATVVKITRSVRGYEIFTDRLYLTSGLLVAVLVAVGALSMLALSYPLIALAISACLCVGIAGLVWMTLAFAAPANRNANEEESKVGGALADRLIGNHAVKSFTAEQIEGGFISRQVARWRVIEYRSWAKSHIAGLFYETTLAAAIISGIYLCVQYTQQGLMPLSDVAMVFFTIMLINSYTRQLGRIILDMQKALNDIEDGIALDALTPEPSGHLPLKDIGRSIGFHDVKFYYPDKANLVLDIPFLEIPKGQKLGLLGHSGAGKSTLVSLLMRFYDVSTGRLCIDGQSLAETDLRSLRRQIAVIPQDTALFHRSLLDNIQYGRIEASEAEVIEASKKAHAHEFICQLPNGYHTLVGERGIKLSGGQRQRIAIARAILKDAPILILDEATSALDTESEMLIQESLHALMAEKTVVAIAHRLSTIHRLDRLIVLEGGKILEDGPHEALLKKNGLYTKLWKMQSGGFIMD